MNTKPNEIMHIPEQAPKRMDARKSSRGTLPEIIGQTMGLIACMCVSAIVIALTVKFIMWLI